MSTSFPESLIPATEADRLRALHLYQIANTPPEPIFDNYVELAAQLFDTPIAVISLVDEEHVWFKAVAGADEIASLPRAESMCSAAILPNKTIVTSDYTAESCRLIKPDVARSLGLNFYAGSALRMPPNDARIGMMAIIGREHRTLSGAEEQFQYLQADLAPEWEATQREIMTTLVDNATLVRYLTARSNGLNLNDPEIQALVLVRFAGMAKVLGRRMQEVSAAA